MGGFLSISKIPVWLVYYAHVFHVCASSHVYVCTCTHVSHLSSEVVLYTYPTTVLNISFLAATFDVQTATVEGGSEIEITVNFISNSLAMGCLVVLQSDSGSPDEFRVLLRSGSDLTVTDMISVPPSTYTLYVYDLEEDGHVNREPAILPEDRIQVTTKCKLTEKYLHCNIVITKYYTCTCMYIQYKHQSFTCICWMLPSN